VLGTPPAYRAELPEEVPRRVHRLLVFPRRPIPDIFWYTARFEYSLAAQPGRAPLVFVIPGTGADHNSTKTLIMQRILYKAGLHVVALTSPVHPNFIVSASSTSTPGLITEDAEDLYRVMRLARRQIGDRIEVSKFYLAGYSLGATQAAFVARLDDERGEFGFDKVLLINPPVNLYNSARILWGENERLKAYNFDFGTKRIDSFRAEGTQFASGNMAPPGGMPGGRLVVSSNGTTPSTGVVWGVYPTQGNANSEVVRGALVAYDATTIINGGELKQLFHSDANPAHALGNFAKYSTPVVANGRVYVGTFSNKVVQYGL
jgi:hypothetical protein